MYEIDNPQVLAFDIFKDLTGQPFPECVCFVQETQRTHIGGYQDPHRGVISSRGLNNVFELRTLLHELGHAIVQYHEFELTGFVALSNRIDNRAADQLVAALGF